MLKKRLPYPVPNRCLDLIERFPQSSRRCSGPSYLHIRSAVFSLLSRRFSQNWRDLTFIGAELKEIPNIYSNYFEFPDLDEALQTGILSDEGHPVYLFLTSERIAICL